MKLFAARTARPSYAELPFFSGWTDAELTRLERLVEVVEYEPGDIIAAGGSRSREFVVITVGTVDIVEGRRRLSTLHEGDTIGAEGMLTDLVPKAAAIAQTYVCALSLGQREFHGLLREAPSMGRRLSLLLAARLAATAAPA